jgi:uncharacterized membrane protein YfcA
MPILTALIAFLLAALSGMGVGGGGLFMIYLAYVTDLPQLTAQGMNLLFFLCAGGASLPVHLRKRSLPAFAIAIMIGAGVVGVLIGTELAARLNGSLLRKIFGAMLVSGGVLSLKRKSSSS